MAHAENAIVRREKKYLTSAGVNYWAWLFCPDSVVVIAKSHHALQSDLPKGGLAYDDISKACASLQTQTYVTKAWIDK